MLLERLKQSHGRPLECRAMELLQHVERYPGLPSWQEHDIVARLVHAPSFEPYTVWALHHRGDIYTIRRVQWDHAADEHPLVIAPTTYAADSQLPEDTAECLLRDLASMSLPPFLPAVTFGLDGTSYEIGFGNFYTSACLSWREKPPREWQPLAEWYANAVQIFDSVLPVSTLSRKLGGFS